MRTIPFSILSSDYTALVVSGVPTATVQYGSGAATSTTVTQHGNGWSVDVDETQDALVIVTLTGAAPCAFTVLAARAAVVADKTGYALTTDYDHAKDDVLTPLAAKASQASITALGTPMQAASYTAPDNTTIASIAAKTANLPATPASKADADAATAAANAAKTSSDAAARPGDPMTLTNAVQIVNELLNTRIG